MNGNARSQWGNNMVTQLDLFARPERESSEHLARRIVAHLAGRGWLTAAQIVTALGLPEGESGKRQVRAAAEASGGELISGQDGYKLTAEATPDELHHASAWLESQGRTMIARAVAQRNVWHARGALGRYAASREDDRPQEARQRSNSGRQSGEAA